jgi:hypothetical protein
MKIFNEFMLKFINNNVTDKYITNMYKLSHLVI